MKTYNETCFSSIFFSDESSIYLYNTTGARCVERKEKIVT